MDASFWHARWEAGQIGFHEGRPNGFLTTFASALGPARRVLVPLCGKTVDLAYLASLGHHVVGVELVEAAVAAFFAEHGLAAEVTDHGRLRRYRHDTVEVWAGDLFAVEPDHVGAVDALYDRAALIALPPPMRDRYVEHLRGLLAPATPGLLITLDYPAEAMAGPPFAVGDAEVRERYPAARLLDERVVDQPRLAAMGVTAVERCYAIATS